MSSIALPLINALAGLAGIGIGVGFGVAEKAKVEELNNLSDKLKKDVSESSDLYDHTYYLVVVNLGRVKHAIDKLPDDFLQKVQKDINDILKGSEATKAISLLGNILSYGAAGTAALDVIIKVARKIRARRQAAGEREPATEDDPNSPWEGEPEGSEPPAEGTSSTETLPETTTSARLIKGINVAGVVFAVGGLAVTIGLGIWTIVKLNQALDEVNKKEHDVRKFQEAMTKVLDSLVKDAGLPPKSYDKLQAMAAVWKKVSEHYEGYSKVLYFAIEGYYLNRSYEDVKKLVQSKQDEGERPFPEDAYPLAKTLADDIRVKFKEGLTDKQVVAFFATDNPKEGLRFVFDEFFISTLRMLP